MTRTAARPVVGVAGLGYMGLATGLAFSARGWSVVGFDILPATRQAVAHGQSPYSEVGLTELLREQRRAGRFRVVPTMEDLATTADVIFLCLPTPSTASGRIDLRAIRAGSQQLGRALHDVPARRLVVVKSTVVPGTTERVVGPILRRTSGRGSDSVAVASNPEFLAEGTMVHDALHPDRAVIGTSDAWSRRQLARLYEPFRTPIIALLSGAELVKYASNSFLAMKVSFANEISRLAEPLGVNIDDAMGAVGEDGRIGRRFLRAGPGFGGSCFDKDLRALVTFAADEGVPFRLGAATLQANADRLGHIRDLVHSVVPKLRGKDVTVLGLAFKAGTDDVRESRALSLIDWLLRDGARVRAHDPVAIPRFRREWVRLHGERSERGLRFVRTIAAALDGADIAILHTDWPEYARWTSAWSRRMGHPLVVDLRRSLSAPVAQAAGLELVRLGVGAAGPIPEGRRRA